MKNETRKESKWNYLEVGDFIELTFNKDKALVIKDSWGKKSLLLWNYASGDGWLQVAGDFLVDAKAGKFEKIGKAVKLVVKEE